VDAGAGIGATLTDRTGESMTSREEHDVPTAAYATAESEPQSFADAIRFLYVRRVRLAARFALFLGLGAIGFVLWLSRSPRIVEGRIALAFPGIERGQYPSGRPFTIEDFRSPAVLRGAVQDAGLPVNTDLNRLAADIDISPVIPAEVAARWRKQDRDGVKREEFVPNQYHIQIALDRDVSDKSARLFDAIVKRYRERTKFEQKSSLRFTEDLSASAYEDLVKKYDYWEIPQILEQNANLLERHLDQLIREAKDYKDSRSQYSFRNIASDLSLWRAARLEALKGLTYRGKLVRDKDTALLTAQYRLQDTEIAVRQANEETMEAMRLLEAAQKPQGLAVTQGSGREAIPIVDSAVIDRLVKSDYISPLVQRISDLQTRAKELEAIRSRLEKDLVYLQQAKSISPDQLPPNYRGLIDSLSTELREILKRYNALLDGYLSDSITNLVTVREGPRLTRGTSLTLVGLAILVFSALLALLAVLIEQLIHKALALSPRTA
jgi:hypothetical protein